MNLALVLVLLSALDDEAPAAAPAVTEPAPVAAPAPAPAPQATAQERIGFGAGPFEAKFSFGVRLAQSLGNPVVLDETNTAVAPTPFETRLRGGMHLSIKNFSLIGELDVATGAIFGTPDSTVVAARVPTPDLRALELRNLYLQYRWETGAARLGVMTNQFGMGMLSNAGAKDPEPGEFGLQHGGVVVTRALVAARPFHGLGGAWKAVEPFAAFDVVISDSTAQLLQGDRALQGIFGVRFNVDDDHLLALTGVYRNQWREGGVPDERKTEVFVGDLYGRWRVYDSGDTALTLAGELATILGTTTQGRSDTAPVLDVRQFGAVAKVNFKQGRFGVLFDGGYASGDQNPYDTRLENFRFDANYKVGLVLFDQVLGYQSARSAWRAADPLLAGVAPEGVDLLPTAGALTGAWFLFPRARFSATDWLDVYGGPLFAFTSAQLVDPFNTRLNGGTPVNALGGRAGSYLGTELDLGVTVRAAVTKFATVTATLEGGLLLPGDAFTTSAGTVMAPAGLGRLRITLATL